MILFEIEIISNKYKQRRYRNLFDYKIEILKLKYKDNQEIINVFNKYENAISKAKLTHSKEKTLNLYNIENEIIDILYNELINLHDKEIIDKIIHHKLNRCSKNYLVYSKDNTTDLLELIKYSDLLISNNKKLKSYFVRHGHLNNLEILEEIKKWI